MQFRGTRAKKAGRQLQVGSIKGSFAYIAVLSNSANPFKNLDFLSAYQQFPFSDSKKSTSNKFLILRPTLIDEAGLSCPKTLVPPLHPRINSYPSPPPEKSTVNSAEPFCPPTIFEPMAAASSRAAVNSRACLDSMYIAVTTISVGLLYLREAGVAQARKRKRAQRVCR